jgi:phage terminase large subunit-like protein
MRKKFERYIDNVLSGKVGTGELTRLGVERCVRDMDKSWEYQLNWMKVERVCNFFELLYHWKGQWAGTPIHLEDHQVFYLGNLFGWENKETGLRRFRTSFKSVARKNAKTTECAGKAIYHLMADGEHGAQVYSAATKEDQARLVVNDAGQIIRKTKYLVNKFKLYRSREKITRILYPATNSFIHPLGSDSDSQDGFDPSYGIIDEYHAHPTDAMLNVIESGMGARRQPLIDIITTAGFNKDYPCYSNLRRVAIEVLKGIKIDESFFALIYEPDIEDDWQDESTWIKSNPNLGVSVSIEHLRARMLQAKNEGGSKEVDFKTKNLNIWTDASVVWISDEKWMECNFGKFEPQKGMECFGGLDLASVRDITALVFVFVTDKIHVVPYFFVNEQMVKDRRMDGVRYDKWVGEGFMEITPGNVTDYNYIKKRVMDICEMYDVKQINYDRWNSSQLVVDLIETGVPMTQFGQGFASMNAPTKEMERLVWTHEINHQGNPVLRWMLSNVEIQMNPAGDIKVDKGKSTDKVDGIVATIMAIAGKIGTGEVEEEFVYNEKDILVL